MRRARAGTTVIFLLTGLVFASYASRIPAIQDKLGLSAGDLAGAAASLEGGAVIGLPVGGALVARRGSRRTLRLGFAVYPPALLVIGLVPSLGWLMAALVLMALANSVIDVAMNAQGVELEHRYGRPLLSGLHAGHSFGLLAGALLATAAAAAGVGVASHFAAIAALGLLGGLLATRALVSDPGSGSQPTFVRPRGRLVLLGLVAFCAFMLDGAANNWSAVDLRREHHASPGLAAATFSIYALAVALVRLAGDRVIARLGRGRSVQLGGLIATAGAALTVIAPTVPAALTGWALLGAGSAIIAPAVLAAAPATSDAPSGVAIAAVTTLGYLGSFTGPPLIGAIAQLTTLSTALLVPTVAAAATGLLARRALRTPARHSADRW